jgi:hypothetical protein
MIIRESLRCETCGTPHTVRIGMGQEQSQEHRFPCRNCREDITLALVVDYENTRSHVVLKENAAYAPEEPGAEVVNLDANFLIPDYMQGVDGAFPRFDQMRALAKTTDFDAPRLRNRPDYAAEWKLLRKAWNLNRSGQKPLSRASIKQGSAATLAAGDDLDPRSVVRHRRSLGKPKPSRLRPVSGRNRGRSNWPLVVCLIVPDEHPAGAAVRRRAG